MNTSTLDIAHAESLLAFWRDSGVEACYEDAPVDRTYVAPLAVKAVAKATASVTPIVAGRGGDAAVEARRLAAGADSLEALAQAVAAFEGCPLSSLGAQKTVFGRGDPKAPILIIGEAPCMEDDAQGRPFLGPAGRLLDRMLEAGGLADKVFLTNTVFWRPPGDRPPTPQEQAVCAPFIQRALALMQPRAVLLLGAAAARSVLQTDEGVMRLRGQWKTWRLREGDVSAPALPTLHPAFLLRQPQAKRQAWADILTLAAALDRPNGSEPEA
jgi:uracil-DNA glycosylase family 4